MQGKKIVYFNMQGLRSEEKIVKIAKHQNLMQADIILGSESNINSETPSLTMNLLDSFLENLLDL